MTMAIEVPVEALKIGDKVRIVRAEHMSARELAQVYRLVGVNHNMPARRYNGIAHPYTLDGEDGFTWYAAEIAPVEPERYQEGDVVSITVVGEVVRAIDMPGGGQELKIDTEPNTLDGQWVHVCTSDPNIVIENLGRDV